MLGVEETTLRKMYSF